MSHYYNKEGLLVHPGTPGAFVSPTTILSVRNKPFLQDWRDRVGPEEADRKSKESTDKGTAVHEYIETYLKSYDPTVKDYPHRIQVGPILEYPELIAGFHAWRDKYLPETVAVEAYVRSELHEFAGKVDYICRLGNETWIIDWKTSKHIVQSYELQLAAYRQAWHEMTGEYAKTAIVQLTDQIKRGYRFKEMDGDFGIFMAHKEIYDYSVSIGEIKHQAPQWDGGLIY